MEKKYQDQIKSLQMELDKERENYSSITAKDKQSRDSEMEELRQEEGKLRDQLLQAQKVTFTLTMLNSDISCFENSIDTDQLAS